MLKKFAVVLFAISMSVGTANARVAHPIKHVTFCTDGMVKATCVCSMATAGHSHHALCKPGQWCHTWQGACHA